MPRILSVKNFHTYQHYRDRNPPWIKIHKTLYLDKAFIRLSVESRYLYIGLLTLFSECNNQLEEDLDYIAFRLALPVSKVNLEPLLKHFLTATGEGEAVCDPAITQPKPARPKQTDEEFMAVLKANPAYSHVDWTQEMGRIDAWLSANPSRKKTRKFVVNWLNRIEKPMAVGGKPGQPGPCVWSVYDGMKKRPCGAPPMAGQSRSICAVHMKDREDLDRRIEESKRMARSPGA